MYIYIGTVYNAVYIHMQRDKDRNLGVGAYLIIYVFKLTAMSVCAVIAS